MVRARRADAARFAKMGAGDLPHSSSAFRDAVSLSVQFTKQSPASAFTVTLAQVAYETQAARRTGRHRSLAPYGRAMEQTANAASDRLQEFHRKHRRLVPPHIHRHEPLRLHVLVGHAIRGRGRTRSRHPRDGKRAAAFVKTRPLLLPENQPALSRTLLQSSTCAHGWWRLSACVLSFSSSPSR